MGKGQTKELTVTYLGVDDPFVYYLEVQGKYYQMHSNRGFITIDREASNLTSADFEAEGGEGSTATLTVTSSDESVATASLKTGSNNIIEIISKEVEQEITITVTYGSYEKTCKVKVMEPVLATDISLSAKFGVVTGGESWTNDIQLVASLKPSNVTEKEVTWKSSDESIAIVDNNGLVKAKADGKGGDVTIIATTKDGSNLSEKSTIRVEIFGAIKLTNTSYTDSSSEEIYKTVTIPKDYAVGTSDNINKIDGGLIIQDNTGNQFVWVPVDESAFRKMIDETNHRGNLYQFSTQGTSIIEYSTTGYRELDCITAYDNISSYFIDAGITGVTNASTFKTRLQSEFNSMIDSIKKYHGFFIGRYETGNLEVNEANVPVVQRGNTKTGNVNWYYIYAQCQRIAKNDNVASNMIWGCQWDRVLEWIVTRNGGDYSLVTNSTEWGNYKGTTFDYFDIDGKTKVKSSEIIIPTGSTERNKKNNIYDMAGNTWAYTMECLGDNSNASFRVTPRRWI